MKKITALFFALLIALTLIPATCMATPASGTHTYRSGEVIASRATDTDCCGGDCGITVVSGPNDGGDTIDYGFQVTYAKLSDAVVYLTVPSEVSLSLMYNYYFASLESVNTQSASQNTWKLTLTTPCYADNALTRVIISRGTGLDAFQVDFVHTVSLTDADHIYRYQNVIASRSASTDCCGGDCGITVVSGPNGDGIMVDYGFRVTYSKLSDAVVYLTDLYDLDLSLDEYSSQWATLEAINTQNGRVWKLTLNSSYEGSDNETIIGIFRGSGNIDPFDVVFVHDVDLSGVNHVYLYSSVIASRSTDTNCAANCGIRIKQAANGDGYYVDCGFEVSYATITDAVVYLTDLYGVGLDFFEAGYSQFATLERVSAQEMGSEIGTDSYTWKLTLTNPRKYGDYVDSRWGDGTYIAISRGDNFDPFRVWFTKPSSRSNSSSSGGGSSRTASAIPVGTTLSTLRSGSSGDSVKVLQARLNALGYSCGTADGVFGPATYAAIVKYQKAMGLTADGIVGKLTWAKLGGTASGNTTAAAAKTSSAVVKTLLCKGSSGETVKYLQTRLNTLGYNCGSVDGVFGPATYAAVTKYQSAMGLTVDGLVGNMTWGKLG